MGCCIHLVVAVVDALAARNAGRRRLARHSSRSRPCRTTASRAFGVMAFGSGLSVRIRVTVPNCAALGTMASAVKRRRVSAITLAIAEARRNRTRDRASLAKRTARAIVDTCMREAAGEQWPRVLSDLVAEIADFCVPPTLCETDTPQLRRYHIWTAAAGQIAGRPLLIWCTGCDDTRVIICTCVRCRCPEHPDHEWPAHP